MASRVICSRSGIIVFAVGFSFYFFMKYYLISVAVSEGENQLLSQTLATDKTPVPTSAVTTLNSSFEALFGNESCRADVLDAPAFVRAAGCNNGECDTITCQRLLVGDEKAVAAAIEFTSKHQRKVIPESEMLKKVSDCEMFRKRGGYRNTPLRPSDNDFPVAFNILVHWHLEQFERLLRAIYRPQNVYCIHVDAKASWTFHSTVTMIARCLDNVYIATRRQHVVYAGFSRLQVRSYSVPQLMVLSVTAAFMLMPRCSYTLYVALPTDIENTLKLSPSQRYTTLKLGTHCLCSRAVFTGHVHSL